MIYNELANIPIRNYFKAAKGELQSLIKDNEKHKFSELVKAWSDLQAERIECFGISNNVLNELEDMRQMALYVCKMFEDDSIYPDSHYYVLKNQIKNDNFDENNEIEEGKLMQYIFDGTKQILNPLKDTAYTMLMLIDHINNNTQ